MINKVYLFDVAPLQNDDVFKAHFAAADKARQEKIKTFRRREDKNLSLGADILIKKGAADCGFLKNPAVKASKFGKPYFEGADNVFFSISHSGRMVMCAFSACNVGADIEIVKTADLKVAKKMFSKAEYDCVMSMKTADETNAAFFRIWTLKESYSKADGKGIKLPFAEFETVCENGLLKQCNGYRFSEFKISGYAAAVCHGSSIEKFDFETVTI